MLDAYIIDRIRREEDRGRQKDARVPLYIDERPANPKPRDEDQKEPDRGSTIVDYSA